MLRHSQVSRCYDALAAENPQKHLSRTIRGLHSAALLEGEIDVIVGAPITDAPPEPIDYRGQLIGDIRYQLSRHPGGYEFRAAHKSPASLNDERIAR